MAGGETVLDERCEDCDTKLVRVSGDDDANPHGFPVVTCAACLEVVRYERGDA